MGGWINVMVVGLVAASPMDLQALVSKAGQHAAAQEQALEHVKVTTTSTQQELNGSGDVKHNSEIVATATPMPDGKKKHAIVKAFEDGKDISEAESKKMRMAMAGADKPGPGQIDNPFLPSNQSAYHFWLIGPDPKHPGWTRVGFGPSGKLDVNRVAGEALIDDQGYLRHLSQKPSRLPSHMEEVSMTSDYSTPSPWGPLRTKMTVDGKGRIFYFFHRQVKGTMTFSYDLPPADAEKDPSRRGQETAPTGQGTALDGGTVTDAGTR